MTQRTFRLYWRDGKTQDVSAEDQGSSNKTAAAAITAAGYGHGAMAALDYWEEIAAVKSTAADDLADVLNRLNNAIIAHDLFGTIRDAAEIIESVIDSLKE